ncbi:hypothetical protein BDR07DRAFT_633944 [Suillus spraguei]|nr:hypothetical protein BDR07DRAFT_633944 [Suillus spraguei]
MMSRVPAGDCMIHFLLLTKSTFSFTCESTTELKLHRIHVFDTICTYERDSSYRMPVTQAYEKVGHHDIPPSLTDPNVHRSKSDYWMITKPSVSLHKFFFLRLYTCPFHPMRVLVDVIKNYMYIFMLHPFTLVLPPGR